MPGSPAADLLYEARARERAASIPEAIQGFEAAIVTAERLQIPTTPVPSPIREVFVATAVAGPNASPNVISGNHAARKPRSSARIP